MIEKLFSFIFGLCIGSFLNVCIYRLPKDKSIANPPSFCPKCNTPINWYDNIPLLSYLMLRGQCRQCKDKISLRYPLVELITGLIFFVLYAKFGLTVTFFKFIFFFCLLIVVSFIDIDYHAIPVYLCFIGIVVGLAFSLQDTINFIRSSRLSNLESLPIIVAGKALIFGFGFSYLFKFFGDIFVNLYLSWRKMDSIEGETESLGLGDVDFMGMAAVFLGASNAVLIFFIAPFIAIIYAIFALIFKKSHLIPYLPYLSVAAVIAFFWGSNILGFIIYR